MLGLLAVVAPASGKANPIGFEHVRILAGSSVTIISDATVVMDGGRIVAAGAGVILSADAQRRNYRGRMILPSLISDHSHVGSVAVLSTGPQNYTTAHISAQLDQYPRYGVTTVFALGMSFPHRTTSADGAKGGGGPDPRDPKWPRPHKGYYPLFDGGADPENVIRVRSHDFH